MCHRASALSVRTPTSAARARVAPLMPGQFVCVCGCVGVWVFGCGCSCYCDSDTRSGRFPADRDKSGPFAHSTTAFACFLV
jgi:hypothetical protein